MGGTKDVGNDSTRFCHSATDWFVAIVAIQYRLGLLPERIVRVDSIDFGRDVAAGTRLAAV